MSWFSKGPRPAHDDEREYEFVQPPRTASDEYIEGLKFIANIYEARGRDAQRVMKERATEIVNATNLERVSSHADEIRRCADSAHTTLGLAEEIRSWVGDFLYRGYRPPHLPPLPPDPAKPESQGGE